ncbi:MAG: hypothetical protein DWQ05_22580 [Calditrichaeota bacterium]|nr:MAG: hypothetical protein DWQ05_22580 [Calditrichota bacterium]
MRIVTLILLLALIFPATACLKRTRINLSNKQNVKYDLVEIIKTNGQKVRLHNCEIKNDGIVGKFKTGEKIVIPRGKIYNFSVLTEYSMNEDAFFIGSISLLTVLFLFVSVLY